MKIAKALPPKRMAAALKRSSSDEWKALYARSVARLQKWWASSDVDKSLNPALHFGYGKDAMATAILMKDAGVPFTALVIDCLSDLPGHEYVVPEFREWLGEYDEIIYATENSLFDYMVYWLNWAKAQGSEVDYFNWGPAEGQITWEISGKFDLDYDGGRPGVMHVWGNRAAEGMKRFYEAKKKGLFWLDGEQGKFGSYWRALPISDWRDVDVWALLASRQCPVSSVYSQNRLPMGGGKKAFPRTVWWCAPDIMNPSYYKWLGYYYPALLKKLVNQFPEVKARFTKEAKA